MTKILPLSRSLRKLRPRLRPIWDYNDVRRLLQGGGDASGSCGRFLGQRQVELGGADGGGRRSDSAALQVGEECGRGGAAVGGAENGSGRRIRVGPCQHQHSTIKESATLSASDARATVDDMPPARVWRGLRRENL